MLCAHSFFLFNTGEPLCAVIWRTYLCYTRGARCALRVRVLSEKQRVTIFAERTIVSRTISITSIIILVGILFASGYLNQINILISGFVFNGSIGLYILVISGLVIASACRILVPISSTPARKEMKFNAVRSLAECCAIDSQNKTDDQIHDSDCCHWMDSCASAYSLHNSQRNLSPILFVRSFVRSFE